MCYVMCPIEPSIDEILAVNKELSYSQPVCFRVPIFSPRRTFVSMPCLALERNLWSMASLSFWISRRIVEPPNSK